MTRAGRHWRIIAPLNARPRPPSPSDEHPKNNRYPEKGLDPEGDDDGRVFHAYSPRAAIKAALARGPDPVGNTSAVILLSGDRERRLSEAARPGRTTAAPRCPRPMPSGRRPCDYAGLPDDCAHDSSAGVLRSLGIPTLPCGDALGRSEIDRQRPFRRTASSASATLPSPGRRGQAVERRPDMVRHGEFENLPSFRADR
jgi:hypothetical protein